MKTKFLKGISIFLLSALIFSGCSSSSYSERYSKPREEVKESNGKKIRFTSQNDQLPNDTTNTTTANEIQTTEFNDVADVEFDDIPIEENPIDINEFVSKYDKLKNYDVALTQREKILFEVIKYLDTPYKYGGSTSKGIDCSAFTQKVYQNSTELELPRSASEQYHLGTKVTDKTELKFGDLVFFNTRRRSFPGHVGIYLGDNKFAHASRSNGVIVSSIDDAYYRKRFVGARRIEKISE